MPKLPDIDPMFHQSVRTRIAMMLYIREPSFSELKSSLAITDGNLDAHLRKLSAAGYLHSRMVLDGRPHTVYQLSEGGRLAFEAYVNALRELCDMARPKTTDPKNAEPETPEPN